MRAHPATLGLVLVTLVVRAPAALAQPSEGRNPDRTQSQERSGFAAAKLAEEAIRLESVGLRFYPPDGARADSTSVGGQSSVSVKDPGGRWVVNVLTPRTSNPQTTVSEVSDEAIKQIAGAAGAIFQGGQFVGWKGRIIGRDDNLVINDRPASRFYLEVPQAENDPPLVRGYTVFKVGNDRFTIFDLTTTLSDFDSARGTYETFVGTASFEDPGALAAQRGAAVSAGVRLVQQLGVDGLREIALANPERWERLYRPGPTGAAADDTEVAYRRIRTWLGKRGELAGDTKGRTLRGIEAQEGVLVRVDSRLLDGARVIDSQGIYFVSFDREEEAWTLSNSVREGEDKTTFTETGARSGRQMTVATTGSSDPGQTVRPTIQGEGYLSRVESFLIPQIIIRGKVPADYGFYVFQSDTGNIRLRRDELARVPDREDLWKVSTTLRDDAGPMVSVYTDEGVLVRTDMTGNQRWEPTTLPELVKLWRGKNLPME